MHSSDAEKLLNDLLHEGEYGAFKQEVYENAMGEFRLAHRMQSAQGKSAGWKNWVLPLAASVIVLAGVSAAWWNRKEVVNQLASHPVSAPSVKADVPDWMVTKSIALNATEIISEVTMAETIQSQPLVPGMVVNSSSEGLAIVSTPTNLKVPVLNDAELLSLFPDQPVLLAVISSSHKRFVLVEGLRE